MADMNRDGIPPLRLDSNTLASTDTSKGSRYSTTNKLFSHKRTRSQLNVPDTVLRLPFSRSPFKDARKAHVKAREISSTPRSDSQSHTPRPSKSSFVDRGEAEAEMETCADGEYEGEEDSTDSLFSPASNSGKGPHEDSNGDQIQQSMWPTGTKKRPSPDADPIRAVSSPGSERQSKRAKVDAFRVLGRASEHLEYHEPLRDADTSTPARSRRHKRAASTKPSPSPSKVASSNFPPRAQSVPLGGEEVRVIDLTSLPPSPQRSPSKGVVEVRRALSMPPPDEDRMDADFEDNSALLHFTNPTLLATPRANPIFNCTVNFATPRESPIPHRSGLPLASPLSPLTPLPSSPVSDHPPEIQSLLANANARLRKLSNKVDTDTDTPTGSRLVIPLIGHTTGSRMPVRPLSVASTSRPTSGALDSSGPWVDTVTRGADLAPNISSNNLDDTERMSTNIPTDLSLASDSRTNSNAIPISRPKVIGSMKPKRGPSTLQGSKRVTRSVSMKEQRVKSDHAEIEDTMVTGHTPAALEVNAASETDPSAEVETIPSPSTAVVFKPRVPTSTATSKSRLPLTARRSTSISKLPSDPKNLRQTSLNVFVKPKLPTICAATGSDSMTTTSTSNANSSRIDALPSPSKIPLPASPTKRPSMTQFESTKSFLLPGSNGTGSAMGTSGGISGRSLTTLSHALDKLVVPPPSRPNTSMGFVRADGGSEDSTPETRKGKGKAKDDASLPSTAGRLDGGGEGAESGGNDWGIWRERDGWYFGKMGDRASKKTSLPVVEGSPVKGSLGTVDDADTDNSGVGKPKRRSIVGTKDTGGDEDVFMSQGATVSDVQDVEMHDVSVGAVATAHKPSALAAVDLTMSPISADVKGKQRAPPPSALNPASSALHALSQSLSSLPETPTPPKPKVLGTRTGLRSSTAAAGKDSPTQDGSGSVGLGGNNDVHGSGGPGPSGTVNGSGGVKKSSLKILKRCAIFVDVRTEQGDDAGGLFVDMLKGLGAKIMGRLGRSCTHIVYKNGHPNTLTRYRLLDSPKPAVVGIAWVVECVEKRTRLDEEKFKIDVDMINVAGGSHKRRRSMVPKHLIPASPGPDYEIPTHMSSEVDDDDEADVDGSPSQDPDLSIRSREDDLPPLERARLRRSILPGGQTRLVP
ncbi:hypothetical protein JVU11DRAFT_7325 [Chiua virens]|nr:hypothetical protein JVU11DRAFT_7325 [Chiua virens]